MIFRTMTCEEVSPARAICRVGMAYAPTAHAIDDRRRPTENGVTASLSSSSSSSSPSLPQSGAEKVRVVCCMAGSSPHQLGSWQCSWTIMRAGVGKGRRASLCRRRRRGHCPLSSVPASSPPSSSSSWASSLLPAFSTCGHDEIRRRLRILLRHKCCDLSGATTLLRSQCGRIAATSLVRPRCCAYIDVIACMRSHTHA